MKKFLPVTFLGFAALNLSSCASSTLPKSDKYQMEMTLHKTRADLEEVKHDLHSHRMETTILEGKILNQEDSMAALKKEAFDQHQAKLDSLAHQIALLEKKIAAMEKGQEELVKEQQKLSQTSQEMHIALSQSKAKISEMEKSLSLATKSMSEVTKLKKNMQKVNQAIEQSPREFIVESYRVKAGDTLETIAKRSNTSIETLCKINHLEDRDKLLTGQELLVPYCAVAQ